MSMQPPEPIKPEKPKNEISFARIAIWVIVSGIGAYLLITGIIGIVLKGQ